MVCEMVLNQIAQTLGVTIKCSEMDLAMLYSKYIESVFKSLDILMT